MNKKGSLELSVNAIIVLIIALTILGLVIGFAVTKFRGLSGKLGTSEEVPTADSQTPITLPGGRNSITLEKGKEKSFEISVYNNKDAAIDPTQTTLTCSPSDIDEGILSTPTTSIGASEVKSVPFLAKVEADDPVGKYSCELNVNGTTRTIFIEVI